FGWFVDREFNTPITICHYLRHQCRVFCMNLIVIKRQEVYKSHHVFIPFYPRIHLVPIYVSYHMVYIFKTNWFWVVIGFPLLISWQENTLIVFSLNKHMNSLTISIYSCPHYFSVSIFFYGWLHTEFRTALRGLLICLARIVYP